MTDRQMAILFALEWARNNYGAIEPERVIEAAERFYEFLEFCPAPHETPADA